ncbi:MAG TPA: type IX secretion system membrane protein PorP/SprF [Mucilaginibacter sp.]|jgi:type IX secretion system PorP/SprF family membrane protein
MQRLKTYVILLICLAGVSVTHAQQKPQYTQYMLNNLLINPAVSGIENYIDIKAGYRSQWTGLEGAPVTSLLSFSAPLGHAFVGGDAAGMIPGADNPYSPEYRESYQAAGPHHGIGFNLVSDHIGYMQTNNFDASYAYHLGVSTNLNLALGVSAGMNNLALDVSKITLQNPDDNLVRNLTNNPWKPDLGIGVWAYSADYYLGVSALQLLPQQLSLATTNAAKPQNKIYPNVFFTAGYKFYLSEDVAFVPSALVKELAPLPMSFDLNAKMAFGNRFWVGGSYRYQDSAAGLVGLNISSLINVSYSYDYTTSALHSLNVNTHEIMIALMLNNRGKVICPRRTF